MRIRLSFLFTVLCSILVSQAASGARGLLSSRADFFPSAVGRNARGKYVVQRAKLLIRLLLVRRDRPVSVFAAADACDKWLQAQTPPRLVVVSPHAFYYCIEQNANDLDATSRITPEARISCQTGEFERTVLRRVPRSTRLSLRALGCL